MLQKYMLQASLGVQTKTKWHICISHTRQLGLSSGVSLRCLPLKGGREIEEFDTFSVTVKLLKILRWLLEILRHLLEISTLFSDLQAGSGNLKDTTHTEAGLAGLGSQLSGLWKISLTPRLCFGRKGIWYILQSSQKLLVECCFHATKKLVCQWGNLSRCSFQVLTQESQEICLGSVFLSIEILKFFKTVLIVQVMFTNTVSEAMQAGVVVFLCVSCVRTHVPIM